MTSKKSESKNKKKIWTILIISVSFLLFSIISVVISFMLIYKDTIHNGIYIENIDIGGLNVVDANDKIEKSLNYVLDNDKLILKYKEQSWKFNCNDLGLEYNFLKAVNDAYLIGRRGTFLDRIGTVIDLMKKPYNMSLKPTTNEERIYKILSTIEKDINHPGVDASIKRENGEFIVTKEIVGLRLNKEKTAEKISQSLVNSKFYDICEIDLIIETKKPKYTENVLKRINDLLGSYTTKFNLKNVGRSYNVGLASKSINGTVLLPGEIFSFNDIVGPRTLSNGYKIAPVIFKGELVDGVGGGICQVSSTLYNSVLLSQLEVIERTNHTIPSTYVPIGLDATVSYGVLDFKFQNNSDSPIYIESFIKGNKITVNIYGEKNSNREVKLTSKIDKVIKKDTEIVFDDNMLEGEEVIEDEGRDGYKVSAYMLVYENGKFIEKKLISKDYYRPSKEIIKKGAKKINKEENKTEYNNEQNNLDVNN